MYDTQKNRNRNVYAYLSGPISGYDPSCHFGKHLTKLNYFWRVFATGLSFVLFGLGGLLLSIIVFPLMFLFIRNHDRRQHLARKLVGSAFGVFIRFMQGVGVITYKISGLEYVSEGQNYLVIANHPTLIDVVFLVSMFPLSDCVVKGAVVRNPFMRGVALATRYIAGDDPGELLSSCVDRLRTGASLILFPEGTRSVPGQELQFRLGAAAVAIRSQARILPVLIQCSEDGFLSKNVPWYKAPPQCPKITIQVQPPLHTDHSHSSGIGSRQETRQLNSRLLDFYRQNLSVEKN
jgi:1-acyl-sn-glycerol-3-phosphate acyltransferase